MGFFFHVLTDFVTKNTVDVSRCKCIGSLSVKQNTSTNNTDKQWENRVFQSDHENWRTNLICRYLNYSGAFKIVSDSMLEKKAAFKSAFKGRNISCLVPYVSDLTIPIQT